MKTAWRAAAAVAALGLPAVASAHGFAGDGGPAAGMLHPLTGVDHLLAMLTVGVLSAQLGGRAIWVVPTGFVACMVVGGLLGAGGIALGGRRAARQLGTAAESGETDRAGRDIVVPHVRLDRGDRNRTVSAGTASLDAACVARVTVFDTVSSPVGTLLLLAEDAGLMGVYLDPHRHGPDRRVERVHVAARPGPAADIIADARAQLAAYFAGTRTTFSLPLVARGTPFQARVWTALQGIRFGETISYAELARRIAAPTAVRAVGAANGRNPLSIIVPCHRVIGADGSLTGFGGGIERKRWLLQHEGARDVSGQQLVLV